MKPLARQAVRFRACWRCWRWSRACGSGGAAGSRWCSSSRSRWHACWPRRRASGGSATMALTCRRRARLGGTPHPLLRRIVAPSEKRIRTLIQELDAEKLDQVIGGWLRDLARAGRLEPLLTAIAIDAKWLRGVGDGQVKLFAALLHEEKMIIAQHRIHDETTETTQVKELLEPVDLQDAVVTADAAHAQRETAGYIAWPEEDGGRESDYFLFVEHASHCSCCWSWRVKESSLAVSGLDTEPFAASAGEVDGGELAALDLVQHGLAGDAVAGGGLAEGQLAVGCLGPDPVAELLVDADLPGCSGGELLAGDEAVA